MRPHLGRLAARSVSRALISAVLEPDGGLRLAAKLSELSPAFDLRAAAPEDAASYAPQLDPVPAGVSLGILIGAGLLRRKINGAIAARERSEAALAELKRARVAVLSGEYDSGDLARLEVDAKALARAAEDARTITIAGVQTRVMVPLPLGSAAPGTVSPRDREPVDQGGAQGTSATMRGIVLLCVVAFVVGIQLWLLALMTIDPMGGSLSMDAATASGVLQ